MKKWQGFDDPAGLGLEETCSGTEVQHRHSTQNRKLPDFPPTRMRVQSNKWNCPISPVAAFYGAIALV